MDNIINEVNLDKVGVVCVGDNMKDARLRWFGHLQKRPPTTVVRRCEGLVLGDFRRGRGMPKKSWKEVVIQDLSTLALSEVMMMYRDHWRCSIQAEEV